MLQNYYFNEKKEQNPPKKMKLRYLLFFSILLSLSLNLHGQELISRGKPVTASNTYNSASSTKFVTDGSVENFWNAGGYAPQWVQIDLQNNYDISSIKLIPETDRRGKTVQKISVSEDLKDWKEIDSFEEELFAGKAVIRNYKNILNIRAVKILTVSSPTWIAWREIEIFGTITNGGTNNYDNSNLNSVNIYELIKKIDCYTQIKPEIFTFPDKDIAFVKISENVLSLINTQDLQEKAIFNFKEKGNISLSNSYMDGNYIILFAIRNVKGEIKEYVKYNLAKFTFEKIKCKDTPRGCIVSSASSNYVSMRNNTPYDFGNFKIFFRSNGSQYFYDISKIVEEKTNFNNAMKGSRNEKLDFIKKYPNSEYKNDIITSFVNSFTTIKDISDFIKNNKEFNNQLDERAFLLVKNSNSESELQEYISVFPNGKYTTDISYRIATIRQAKADDEKRIIAERQAQQEKARLAESQKKEEQARLAEAKEKEAAIKKNCVGKKIYWHETISYDTSGGGVVGFLASKVGLGSTNYSIKYTAIVESMIGESAVKALISKAVIEDPSMVSANYIKYKSYAIEEMNKVIGQTRVKEFHEFNLDK